MSQFQLAGADNAVEQFNPVVEVVFYRAGHRFFQADRGDNRFDVAEHQRPVLGDAQPLFLDGERVWRNRAGTEGEHASGEEKRPQSAMAAAT